MEKIHSDNKHAAGLTVITTDSQEHPLKIFQDLINLKAFKWHTQRRPL